MHQSPNPFLVGNPVPPERFVGLSNLLQALYSRIYNSEFTNIVGGPKIGKSSLLNFVASPYGYAAWAPREGRDVAFFRRDCQSFPAEYRPADFWRDVLAKVAQAFPGQETMAEVERARENGYDSDTLSWLFEQLGQRGRRIHLLLDEAETLLERPAFNNGEFLSGLRSVSSASPGLNLVFASHTTIAQMNERARAVTGSPPFNTAIDLRMRALSEQEANLLITRCLAGSGVEFSAAERSYCYEISGGHPYLMQLTASALFDERPGAAPVEAEARRIEETITERADHLFASLWQRSAGATRAVLQLAAAPAGGPRPDVARHQSPELSELEREGLLVRAAGPRGASWRIKARALALWLDAAGKSAEHAPPRPAPPPEPRPAPPPEPAPPPPGPLEVTLRFQPRAGGATIGWESELGPRESSFDYPYQLAQLPTVIKALDAVQYPDYPDDGPAFSPGEAQILSRLELWRGGRVAPEINDRVGAAIYQALIKSPAGELALKLVRESARHQGRPLRYILRLPARAVALSMLPWELMRDNRQALLFSRGDRQPDSLERYIDLEEATAPPVQPGGRLRLLAITPKNDVEAAIREAERAARHKSWEALRQRGLLEWEELEDATLPALERALRRGPRPDIVHFYGHGEFRSGRGYLSFDHPTRGGESALVRDDQLAAILGRMRLIVLFACQSARAVSHAAERGPITGVAHAISAVSEAVVAMQFNIRVSAATRFSEVLYEELTGGRSLQAAVADARRAVRLDEDDGTSWYVPTLYVRARRLDEIVLFRPD